MVRVLEDKELKSFACAARETFHSLTTAVDRGKLKRHAPGLRNGYHIVDIIFVKPLHEASMGN